MTTTNGDDGYARRLATRRLIAWLLIGACLAALTYFLLPLVLA